jgi:hypothetical protein
LLGVAITRFTAVRGRLFLNHSSSQAKASFLDHER